MEEVGGLVGASYYDSINQCYSDAMVMGESGVGGLVGGSVNGSITQSYGSGRVNGVEEVGGLVGASWETEVFASFWNMETSGLAASAGGIGLTTAEMQTASTFLGADWDFIEEAENGTDDIWWILEGRDYPRLWWELEQLEEN